MSLIPEVKDDFVPDEVEVKASPRSKEKTIPELKEECKRLNLKVSGTRQELVDRIDADYSFFGTSLAFDLYSSIWKYYFKTYKCDNLIQKGFGGHHAHALAIKKFNLEHKLTGKIAHKVQFFKLQKKEV